MQNHSKQMLKDFFGGYFHEDFLIDHANTDAVLDSYKKEISLEHRSALAKAIRSYAAAAKSDTQLEENLFCELGCYYRPSADGKSATAWLNKISDALLH